jgi:hypothetical protein
MGREARCRAALGAWAGEGKLLLETDDLLFRGESRLRVPLAEIRSAEATDGWLIVTHRRGLARFDLGPAARRWADAINHPKTRIDKLGVKPSSRVLVVGLENDTGFMDEVRARTQDVTAGGRARDHDLIFVSVEKVGDLKRLAALRSRIRPAGAIWIVHPKGRPDLSHDVLVRAAKAAGLIDNKTARFSASHTCLRFVIPRGARATASA